MLKYFCIVSDHLKKCGCIQEWMIDGAGLLTLRKPNMTSDLYNITIRWDGHLYGFMTYNFLCSNCCSTDFSLLFRHVFHFIFQKSSWSARPGSRTLDGWEIPGGQQVCPCHISLGGYLRQWEALAVRDSHVSAAGSVERQEGWRYYLYPSRGSRQGRDQGRIWGTNR